MKKVRRMYKLDSKSLTRTLEENMKREAIISFNHDFSIWQDKRGRWQTYILDPDSKRGRRLICSYDREKLEQRLCNLYKNTTPTFGSVYEKWMDRRLELKQIAPGTYSRNNCTYERHFKEAIGEKQIGDISINDYIDFMETQISKFDLTAKGFALVKTIVKGTVNQARRDGYIEFNGLDVLNEFRVYSEARCRRVIKDDEKEVFNEEETEKVVNFLIHSKKASDTCLLLMFVTGIRGGEAVALKHIDFDGLTVKIRRTESRYRLYGCNNTIVKERPKTEAGIRTVVIPNGLEWLVKRIRAINPFGEYCFIGVQGKRLTLSSIGKRLYEVCDIVGIQRRSTHKIRKTYLSILLDNGIDTNLVTQQAGHTSITTTERFYHWNRKSEERKREILDKIPEFGIMKVQ